MPRLADHAAGSRAHIVATATELFHERGYAATSIRDIADRLGVSKAALYYHFASKDELFLAVIGPTIDRVELVLARGGTLRTRRDRVRFVSELVTALAAPGPAVMRMLADSGIAPAVRDRLDGVRGRVEQTLLANSRLRAGADPLEPAMRVSAAMAACGAAMEVWARHDPSGASLDRGIAVIAQLALDVLEGRPAA